MRGGGRIRQPNATGLLPVKMIHSSAARGGSRWPLRSLSGLFPASNLPRCYLSPLDDFEQSDSHPLGLYLLKAASMPEPA